MDFQFGSLLVGLLHHPCMLTHLHDAYTYVCARHPCLLVYGPHGYIPCDFTQRIRGSLAPARMPSARNPPPTPHRAFRTGAAPADGKASRVMWLHMAMPWHNQSTHARKHMHHGGFAHHVGALPTVIETENPPATCCSQRNRDGQLEGPEAALSQNATGPVRGLASQRGHSGSLTHVIRAGKYLLNGRCPVAVSWGFLRDATFSVA